MIRFISVGLCGLLAGACAVDSASEPVIEENDEIVRGGTETGFPQVVAVHVSTFSGRTLCSGTYVAPRVVLTAAHCMRPDAVPGGLFVYHGDDYNGDVATLPFIPPPGAPSEWARAETFTTHPDYDPGVNYPDMTVLFLDRELPFRPIPILERRVASSVRHGTIVGWGGSRALVPDISQVEGAGIKRSARVRLLGSPTEADFVPEDPNPGILIPEIRADILKTDGRAPRANTCAGDSGGPLFVEHHGRRRLAGVGFWTGLSCEDYSMFLRVEPFENFLEAEFERAGDAPLVPRLECVEELAPGSFRAQFGYANENGVTVEVPHGPRNAFPADAAGARPTAFAPGDNAFAFNVPFAGTERLTWRLNAGRGRAHLVRVDASSPRCDPNDARLLCASQCDASLAAECSDGSASRGQCVSDCLANSGFFNDVGCDTEWNAYLACVADIPPAAENWDCSYPGIAPFPLPPNCDAELFATFACLGY